MTAWMYVHAEDCPHPPPPSTLPQTKQNKKQPCTIALCENNQNEFGFLLFCKIQNVVFSKVIKKPLVYVSKYKIDQGKD
jgi:hypothetical protein